MWHRILTVLFVRVTKADPSDLFENAIKGFIDHVKKKMDAYANQTLKDEKELWDLLQKSDQMSVRQFLLS